MNISINGVDYPNGITNALELSRAGEIEQPVYAIQNYLIGSQLQSIPPYYLPSGFTNSWCPTTWNNFQPLDSPIAVSVAPTVSLQVWPQLAWEQLKIALHEYSQGGDVEMPVGSNLVLQLAHDYLEVTAGDIFPVSFATIVSTSKFFDWIQPLAKRIRSLASFARKGIVLYGRKPFLVSSHEKVSAETAAHEHTLHLESILLARAHSLITLNQIEELHSDSGCVSTCLKFVFICSAKLFRLVSPELPVCSGTAHTVTT